MAKSGEKVCGILAHNMENPICSINQSKITVKS
jgi:hypothetical protein